VSFPSPHPGLVIRDAYLWKQDADAGREEGSKDRPCAVVMAVDNADGEQDVLVLPVTHFPPADAADAVEIPAETKTRPGLDSERSWIVVTEANASTWPGPDVRPIPGRHDSPIAYGGLPPRLFAYVRDRFLELDRRAKASRVRRSTGTPARTPSS
jgi:hypothetical protein